MVNKEVLFSELCSRLPYEVKCDIGDDKPYTLNSIEVDYTGGHLIRFKELKNGFIMEVYLSEVKPYLFPLSSITEDQELELKIILEKYSVSFHRSNFSFLDLDGYSEVSYDAILEVTKWFYKNHFDIHDLIKENLAYSAVGLNIY